MAQLTYEITIVPEKERIILSLKGSLDATNAEGVQAELEKSWAGKEFKQVVWEVPGLELMASAGLRVLMSSIMYCRNKNRAKLYMVKAQSNIVGLIKVAAMTSFVTFVEDVDQIK